APDLFQPLIPAAAETVEAVTDGILPVVFLVIILGRVKDFRGQDPGHHGLLEHSGAGELGPEGFGLALLFFGTIKYSTRVLLALVAELAFRIVRVDIVPEDIQQLAVTDPARIVADLDRFPMPGRARGYLVISGIHLGAAGVAHGRGNHA